MPISNTAVQVGTSPTALFGSDDWSNSATVTILNLGPNDIHVGTVTVTAGTGMPVAANGASALTLDRVNGRLYAVCGVLQVAPADTRVLGDND